MCVCDCALHSQGPQLGHVVEAGQRDEGDVVVVEGAGRRHTEKHVRKSPWFTVPSRSVAGSTSRHLIRDLWNLLS